MTTDMTAPATKQDLHGFMTGITKQIEDLYKTNIRWKEEIIAEIKLHFDVSVENIRHDLKSANKEKIAVHSDKLQNHEHRIRHLEIRSGMRAR